jgi:hypothetical protein
MKRFTYRQAVTGIAAAIACLGTATGAGAAMLQHDDWGRDAREVVTPTAVVRPDDRARHGLEPVAPATIASPSAGGFVSHDDLLYRTLAAARPAAPYSFTWHSVAMRRLAGLEPATSCRRHRIGES